MRIFTIIGRMNHLFSYCPSCGKNTVSFCGGKHWVCSNCGFDMFFNVASSAGVILYSGNSVLFVKRGREPAKGMLALPGGFIDAEETAEEACIRECFEETGIQISPVTYVASFPNSYEFKNIIYSTCDFFFSSELRLDSISSISPLDAEEVEDFEIVKIDSAECIAKLPIAFDSVKKAVTAWYLKTVH